MQRTRRHTAPNSLWDGPPNLMPAAAPRDSAREGTDLPFTVVLFFVALAIRLLLVLLWTREPVWDGHYYHFGAERIAEGFGYSEDVVLGSEVFRKPWTHYPVGYSAFLSIFYALFGSGTMTAPVVGALVGAATVALVHRYARYFVTEDRARIAGGLAALHPGLIAYSALVMTEGLAALLALGCGFLALRFRHRREAGIAVGVVLGLSALVRPSSLFFLPAVFLAFGAPKKRALAQTALAGVVALMTILPWTVRNCRVMDGCALVSTNGGWNLAIGAITETGRFQTLRASDGCPVVTGQVQQDRCWAEVGVEKILDDPVAWLKKAPLKLAQTFDHESFAIEYLHEAAPDLWPEPRRQAGRQLLTFFHRVLVILASLSPLAIITSTARRPALLIQGALIIGISALCSYCLVADEHPFYLLVIAAPLLASLPLQGSPTAGPGGRYLYALIAMTLLTHAIFFGDDRYHVVVTPALCILAAAAFRRHPGLLGPRRPKAEVLGEPVHS